MRATLITCLVVVAGCNSADVGDDARACPTANAALAAECEPRIAQCVPAASSVAAETFRGQFGSVAPDGTCQRAWPEMWLASCTEPLAVGVPDLRGLWADEGHVERIEQCGNLVLIVGENYTHGGFATGLPEDGVNDVRADGTCSTPIRVALRFDGPTLEFVVAGFVVVKRTLEVSDDGADELVWRFGPGLPEVARMRRRCTLADVPPTASSGLPGSYSERVRVEPFEAVELELGALWGVEAAHDAEEARRE
jgi:hypothetical protein